MSMKNWSTTAGSNATVDSISFAEGQAPSSLNDSARALMADVRYELATQDTIASATTTDLGSKDAGSLTISGTTTITGFGTVSAGIRKLVTHSGALTLTHNGTSLILPGAANITTVAGDSYIAESLGSGNWKVHSYQKATQTGSGANVNATSPTLVTPTLGVAAATSINFGQTALSYYGEGTWTPSDGSGAGLSFTSPLGTYTRIGRMFLAGFSLTYPATASGANATVDGIPFTVANSATARTGFVSFCNSASNVTQLAPTNNATTFFLLNASGTLITNANMSGSAIRGAVVSYV